MTFPYNKHDQTSPTLQRCFVSSVSLRKRAREAVWQKCIVLCVTLTRLEGQPCLSSSSSSSSCVTSTQHLQSNLKGPGLPVSLPTHPRTPPSERTTSQTPLATTTSSALSYQRTHIHAHCPSCILINVFTINSSRQWAGWLAGWLAGCLAADKAQTQPARPRRHKNSAGDKHWPPATSSQLYICHMLMTSSLWPPTDRAVLEGSRLRNKVVSPWNTGLILPPWHSAPRLEGFNPSPFRWLAVNSPVTSLHLLQPRAARCEMLALVTE